MNHRPTGRFIDDFPTTAALLLVIVGFFVLEMLLTNKLSEDAGLLLFDPSGEAMFVLGASVPSRVVHERELWRILAACFLHGGIIHILFNGYMLYVLGSMVEPMLGWERFLTSWVLCGIAGFGASIGWAFLMEENRLAIGASGAILGLIGILLGHGVRQRDRMLRDQVVRWLIYIALFSFLASGGMGLLRIGGIDHAAHLGGLIAGFALGWFVPRYTTSETSRRWRLPAWIAITTCAASLGFSVWWMFQALASIE